MHIGPHAAPDVKFKCVIFDHLRLYGGEPLSCLNIFLSLHHNTLHNFDNKTANINTKNCSLPIVLTVTDQKPQKKSLKGDTTQHHVDIQAI